jgi:hypothetical protein
MRARRRIWAEAEAIRLEASAVIEEIEEQHRRTPGVEKISATSLCQVIDNTDRVLRRQRRRLGIGA